MLLQLCSVIDHIRSQIKKRRVEKKLTQSDVALDLGITPGAYSKIESGPTEISVKKLIEIASILEVDISYFLQKHNASNKLEDAHNIYGYATKIELAELAHAIKKIQQEIASIKVAAPTTGKKKRQ